MDGNAPVYESLRVYDGAEESAPITAPTGKEGVHALHNLIPDRIGKGVNKMPSLGARVSDLIKVFENPTWVYDPRVDLQSASSLAMSSIDGGCDHG
jgi:hypothetical protein